MLINNFTVYANILKFGLLIVHDDVMSSRLIVFIVHSRCLCPTTQVKDGRRALESHRNRFIITGLFYIKQITTVIRIDHSLTFFDFVVRAPLEPGPFLLGKRN